MTAGITLTNLVLCCLTTLFILQICFYYYRTEVNETHRVEWSRTVGECDCTETTTPNCYPRGGVSASASVVSSGASDSAHCGECFSCVPTTSTTFGGQRKAEMVFAFSTHHTFMNKILVLIASIHKYYPSKRILLYDSDVDDKGLLQKQLISIRNVQVLPSAIATKSLQPDALKSQMDALFMLDAVKRYKNVLWLTDDLEILSTNLDEVLNKSTSSVAVIGREYTTDIRKHGFIPYFPGTFSTRNYTLLLLGDGSESMLQWIVKCAAEPNRRCWNCRDVLGEQMDCMPSLIARLSLDIRAEYHMMPSNAVQHQRWQPTTCDARCVAYTFISIIMFLLIAIAIVLLMYSRATSKSK